VGLEWTRFLKGSDHEQERAWLSCRRRPGKAWAHWRDGNPEFDAEEFVHFPDDGEAFFGRERFFEIAAFALARSGFCGFFSSFRCWNSRRFAAGAVGHVNAEGAAELEDAGGVMLWVSGSGSGSLC